MTRRGPSFSPILAQNGHFWPKMARNGHIQPDMAVFGPNRPPQLGTYKGQPRMERPVNVPEKYRSDSETAELDRVQLLAVSYTHLTLPTIYSV